MPFPIRNSHSLVSASPPSQDPRASKREILSAYGDLDAIIGEDERRIGRCQLSVRHLECVDVDFCTCVGWK